MSALIRSAHDAPGCAGLPLGEMRALYGRGEAVPAAEVEERLRAHGILVDADYVDLVRRWGGCFVGVPVHAGGNAFSAGARDVRRIDAARAA